MNAHLFARRLHTFSRFTTALTLLIIVWAMPNALLWGQCNNITNFGAYGGGAAPSAGNCASVPDAWAGEYSTWTSVVSGAQYTVSSSVASDYITIRRTSAGGTLVAHGTQPVVFTAPASDTYYIHVNTNASCGIQQVIRAVSLCRGGVAPTPTYCMNNLYTTGCADVSIISVSLAALSHNDGGCATPPGFHVSNYSNIVFNAMQGQSYSYVVNTPEDPFYVWRQVAFYMDWNNDGDFDDANEYLGVSTKQTSAITGQITIPAVGLGNRRFRVRLFWVPANDNINGIAHVMSCSQYPVGEVHDYTINVQPFVPLNDNCPGAITLVPAMTNTCNSTQGTVLGATTSIAPINCGGFTAPGAIDVWYKFVATTPIHQVLVQGDTQFDAVVDIRSGACNGASIACADNTIAGALEQVYFNTIVGQTYYIRVYHYGAAVPSTPLFALCVSEYDLFPCNTAGVAAACGNGNTINFDPGPGRWGMGSCFSPSPPTGRESIQWYTVQATGLHALIINNGMGEAVNAYARLNTCEAIGWACLMDVPANGSDTIGLNVSQGDMIGILFKKAGTGAGGAVEWRVDCPLACVAGPIAPSAGSEVCSSAPVILNWPAAPSALRYDVYLNLGGVATTLVSSAQTATSFNAGLLPPGNYAWRVVPRYGNTVPSGSCADWALTVKSPRDAASGEATGVCSNASPLDMLATLDLEPGGSWSGPSPVVNNLYDPLTMEPGLYSYILNDAPCPDFVAPIQVTELVPTLWYADADGDGYGDPAVFLLACAAPTGHVDNADDLCPAVFGTVGSPCDDGNPATTNDVLGSNCTCAGVGAAQVTVSVRAVLGGAYDPLQGLMRDALRQLPVFPLAHPYGAAPFGHAGSESVAPSVVQVAGPNAVVDWVLLELRSGTNPAIVVASAAALLQSDGDVVGTDGVSPVHFDLPPGSYHVALRHRNHLGVMSAAPLSLNGQAVSLDLSNLGVACYGFEPRGSVAGKAVLWPGNVNPDNLVKYLGANDDRDPVLGAVGGVVLTTVVSGVYHAADVNLNGEVKYLGSADDRDPILGTIGGVVLNSVRVEQLP